MDANKKIKLEQIDYTFRECCGLCTHGKFPYNEWGTCNRHTYDHKKHSDSTRSLSVCVFGYCNSFEKDEKRSSNLLRDYKIFQKGS